ncbi:MFS transporter [Streptomyces sp. NBC_01166]|uniref:MFS transporter n=1 Tax=Streptomyces sp. NBC_01166 TaxID=2903755 RepID=UPI003870B9CB|nr:MFS transporter [Streptomyces sp. NBC_01166]
MRFPAQVLPRTADLRVLAVATLTRAVGHGVFFTVSVLYFAHAAGMSVRLVGIGMTIAAVAAMAVSVPAGHLADVLGPREVSSACFVLQGIVTCAYASMDGFVFFVAVAVLAALTESAGGAAFGALIAGITEGAERVQARAYLRSVTNAGVAVGALVGGVILSYDAPSVQAWGLVGCGVLFSVGGLVQMRLPAITGGSAQTRASPWAVFRDRRYALVGLLNVALVLNVGLLTIALPLWISERTEAPNSLYAALLVLNTLGVVLFQVRVSRRATDADAAARTSRLAGIALLACCALFAWSADAPLGLAVALLVVGTAVHVLGELLYSAGSWALSYELAPEGAHGQYQGFFGMTSQLGSALTPVAATSIVIGFGAMGWLAFGLLMALAGAAVPSVVRGTRQPVAP